jgi:hypothetical protein
MEGRGLVPLPFVISSREWTNSNGLSILEAMPSNLYRQALDSLSNDERTALESCLTWLGTHSGSLPDDPTDGARILANLQEEAHLVGDRDFGDASELADFLRLCAARFAACTPEERHRAFEEICDEFALRGLRVLREHLPDTLLRYVASRAVAANLIERMLGRFGRDDFDSGRLPPDILFTRLRRLWTPARLSTADRLAGRNKVFATFEHPAGAPRDDAKALSQALALSFWQNPRGGMELLVELTYPTDAVQNHRFPTIADAGWGCFFHPSPEEPPDGAKSSSCCGWSEPLGPHPPQPEIVHDNAPLQVLSHPPRLVGAIP